MNEQTPKPLSANQVPSGQAQKVYFPEAVGILDLFQVPERLWAVAHCLHWEGGTAAAEFVEHRLRDLLQGRVGYVIAGLKRRLRSGELIRIEREQARLYGRLAA